MIDYLSATTSFEGKDINFVAHSLTLEAQYASGWKKYYLQGCERLTVWLHPGFQMLRLEGSISYFWQGHNFSFSRKDLETAISQINRILGVPLWEASLNAFEFGNIMEVQMKPKEYIQHHAAAPKEHLILNEKPKDKGSFRWWEDKQTKLKMYDAKKNLLFKQGEDRRQIIKDSGWQESGEYLKFEAHYLKPEYLNSGRAVMLWHLCNTDWQEILKNNLYSQYKRLLPMKGIITPKEKKDLSTADILLLAMVEDSINEGRTLDELRKMLYNRVNSYPDEVLSKSDKDLRKAQIRKLLSKVQEAPESIYDLSHQLKEALEAEK